jgi:ATP-binding cassette subfamily G (WHITE) protein 2
VLYTSLTVFETLQYAAMLRLPKEVNTIEQREKRIAEAMEMMGITHTHNVVVGNSIMKGISGGERKRLCVGVELLTRPSLLFLDGE